jgi:hypothetical protein
MSLCLPAQCHPSEVACPVLAMCFTIYKLT